MEFTDTKGMTELDIKPAVMTNAHMIGGDEDIGMLTFVQSVPKFINEQGDTVTVKYENVASIAHSNRHARKLAIEILETLEARGEDGTDHPLS